MKESERIIIYKNFVDADLCQRVVEESEFKHKLNIPDGQVYDMDVHSGDSISGAVSELEKIFDHFSDIYGSEYPRLWINIMHYKAGEGMIYRHQDTHNPNPDIQRKSYTIMLYLNNITDGGETVFYFDDEPELVIKPTVGTIVVIPGDIYHEARIPLSEDKYIALTRHIPTN